YYPEKNYFSLFKDEINYLDHYAEVFRLKFLHPNHPLLKAKQLFHLDNLFRKKRNSEPCEKGGAFCRVTFRSLCTESHRVFKGNWYNIVFIALDCTLENILIAIELRHRLCASFPKGSEVSADRVRLYSVYN
nr:dicer-like protein 4 isoform X2 [Tanacetum cinerariifolium]